jgi:hypothetical protein
MGSSRALLGVLFGQRQPVAHDVAGERADDCPVATELPGRDRVAGTQLFSW